jgi:hypothetical protein
MSRQLLYGTKTEEGGGRRERERGGREEVIKREGEDMR